MKDSFAKHNSIGNGHPYNYNGNNEIIVPYFISEMHTIGIPFA